ncbi:MAG: DUF1178 family protein [Sulfitobacter litoralis]|jgi:hypothetical protein|uniref:DUF1178 family protein n=3 Tax=root TaxID=1 RepID=A0A7V1F0C1_9RHOB|nr:DUF1178 family protein [Sulfitobacter litoralis]MCF7725266.1 DUF1178 family protein [Sulfitobacter sp. M22]MCF7776673.1 DUF1178 family protein [Sulfitobacter sp. M220]MBQ0765106.1 DUF1178 family protein [Sulfitobacter litoralis]MBQ0801015.1 DUF1178 family protein [Sulfitobacter litoralis]|tara:strand:- start:763 stop:1236 length:474 start_codon:yes stop_codon:yes gene_type:complete
MPAGAMIKFSLKCERDHQFESWFKSAAAFDALAQAGHLTCAICGSPEVTKGMMAPRVSTGDARTNSPKDDTKPDTAVPVLSKPQSELEKALKALRKKVESSSEYVGNNFVKEARAMHLGDAPDRSIYGEARLDEAVALIEEGIPLTPLPFRAKRSTS